MLIRRFVILFTIFGLLLFLLLSALIFRKVPPAVLRYAFHYRLLQDLLFDARMGAIVRLAADDQASAFEAVWDTSTGVFLSGKIYRPVPMFDQKKYMYRPNIQRVEFVVRSRSSYRYFEALDTPELQAALDQVDTQFSVHASFDEFGFRRSDYGLAADCQKRILFLGDSFTEGLGVDDDDTFVNRFGELVNRNRADKVCVVNSAVNGYGALEEAYIAENYIDRLSANQIVLFVFPNDIDPDTGSVYLGTSPDLNRKWEQYFFYLQKIIAVAKSHGIELTVYAIPPKEQFANPETRKNYQEKLRQYCEAHQVKFVDLYKDIQGHIKDYYFRFDDHFSIPGHKLIAEILNRTLT